MFDMFLRRVAGAITLGSALLSLNLVHALHYDAKCDRASPGAPEVCYEGCQYDETRCTGCTRQHLTFTCIKTGDFTYQPPLPDGCSGCTPQYAGNMCSVSVSCRNGVPNNGMSGSADEGHCVRCNDPYQWFGQDCDKSVSCNNPNRGTPGDLHGDGHCVRCARNYCGKDCELQSQCSLQFGVVNEIEAISSCMCSKCVDTKYFGSDCSKEVQCVNGVPDGGIQGSGYCQQPCANPFYVGLTCDKLITCNRVEGVVNTTSGTCASCHRPTLISGENCDRCTDITMFGPKCSEQCSCVSGNGVCDNSALASAAGGCLCPAGYMSQSLNNSNSQTCAPCSPGTFRARDDPSLQCHLCLGSKWSGTAATQCDESLCPAGFVCDNGSHYPIPPKDASWPPSRIAGLTVSVIGVTVSILKALYDYVALKRKYPDVRITCRIFMREVVPCGKKCIDKPPGFVDRDDRSDAHMHVPLREGGFQSSESEFVRMTDT